MSTREASNTAKLSWIASFNPYNQYFEVTVFWPHYTDKETEEQRGQAVCVRPHSWQEAHLGILNPRLSDSKTHVPSQAISPLCSLHLSFCI